MILWCSIISIGTSIVFKWMFIGKRRPGPVNDTVWRKATDWAANWHFVVGTSMIMVLSYGLRIWNVVLMMHGMDIDIFSIIMPTQMFVPSKVDLVRIRHSLVSNDFSKQRVKACTIK